MSRSRGQRAFRFAYGERFRLEQLEVYSGNERAFAAVLAVARGESPRVVLIHGPAGVGKTHLLRGLLEARPGLCAYVDLRGETPVEEGVAEIDGKGVLLLDHLEALSAAERRYAWVLERFNRFLHAGKGIVGAARRGVSGLEGIDEHLASRLRSGLEVAVHPPDDGVRERILLRWAEERSVSLAPRVVRYILGRVPRGIRQLRELLAELDHRSLAQRRKLSIPLVKEILGLEGEVEDEGGPLPEPAGGAQGSP
jgi:DnaA family protein